MKKILTLLCFLLTVNVLQAQNILWQKTLGGLDLDELTLIKSTPDSGVIVGGISESGVSGNKTDNNISSASDYWVVKLDKSGNIEWQNAVGGNGNDDLHALVVCSDGGYLLGGNSNSNISGDKNSNCDPGGLPPQDIWLVKLNAAGNISWQKNIGGNGTDFVSDMKQTADGGFILGAGSNSDISGDKTDNNFGALDKVDYWILKLDNVGNIQWQKTIGGDLADAVTSIQQTFDGGFIIAGHSDSPLSGNKTESAHMWAGFYYEDYWIVKLDSIGNIIWQKVYGGDYQDVPYSIKQTSDGNYVVAGQSLSDITYEKTEANKGGADYWILKLDQSGAIIWQKDYGGTGDESAGTISQRANGNYLVTGSSNSMISGDKAENTNGLTDAWLLNLDPSGNILWQKDIGGAGEDHVYFQDFITSGDSYLGGLSNSGISGDKTEACYGAYDYWVLKIKGLESYVWATAFLDFNGNNMKDVNDPDYHYGNFKFDYDAITKYSNATGPVIELIDTGKVYYDFIPYNNYFTISMNKDSNIAMINQTDTVICALQPIPNINDIAIHVIPTGPVHPGFNSHYLIFVSNFGSNPIPNTTVKLNKHPNQNFLSSLPAYTNLIADSIWWSLGSMQPFTDTVISLILYNLPPPANVIGDTNHLVLQVTPVLNDNNITNNEFVLSEIYTGSYDPNNKLENYAGKMSYYGALNGDGITYVINFQNTGTDTAFNIFVRDTLDDKIDYNSFTMVKSSHPFSVTANGRFLQWNFENIQLVDSFTNEPGSHGYICYKVKTKQNVQKNDIIRNSAAIFFDFNLPVYTNISYTQLVDFSPVGIPLSAFADDGIFPNPADDLIYFKAFQTNQNASVEIIDLNGKILKKTSLTNPLNVAGLKAGMYFLSVSEGGKTIKYRFAKR